MNLARSSSSLIFIITITTLTGEKLNNCSNPNDICLPYYVIPVHYRIKLTRLYEELIYMEEIDRANILRILNNENEYDKYSFDFYGECNTTINILQSTQYIKLHIINPIIMSWKIAIIKNNGITYKQKNYTKTLETNLLELHFSNVLSPGLYTLKMGFFGYLTESFSKNFIKSFNTNKENGIA